MVAVIQVQTEKKSMITELSPTTINWSEQPYVIRNQEEGKNPKGRRNRKSKLMMQVCNQISRILYNRLP